MLEALAVGKLKIWSLCGRDVASLYDRDEINTGKLVEGRGARNANPRLVGV